MDSIFVKGHEDEVRAKDARFAGGMRRTSHMHACVWSLCQSVLLIGEIREARDFPDVRHFYIYHDFRY